MLTSRISLSLIWLYLKKIEAIEGPIQDIQIAYWSTYNPNRITSPPDILTLSNFSNYSGFDLRTPINPYSIDCEPKELYQLRSFVISTPQKREFIYWSPSGFKTKYISNILTSITLNGLESKDGKKITTGYLNDFDQLWQEWQSFGEYIDCETTLLHFNSSLKRIDWLYKNIE